MRVRRKTINGKFYYYLEETLRIGNAKVYSVFLGDKIPAKSEIEKISPNAFGQDIF